MDNYNGSDNQQWQNNNTQQEQNFNYSNNNNSIYQQPNNNNNYYNQNQNYYNPYAQEQYQPIVSVQGVMVKTYLYMLFALFVSGLFSVFTFTSGLAEDMITSGSFTPLLIAEVVVVLIASSCIRKNKIYLAAILSVIYTILNGISLSIIFLIYDASSIVGIFFVTSAIFGAMALYGHFTKADLSSFGSIFFMALIGILLMTLVNALVLQSEGLDLALSYIGVLVFVGLTAYDAQKIKRMASSPCGLTEHSIALYGAIQLYLDFINIFLRLLRIFAKRN